MGFITPNVIYYTHNKKVVKYQSGLDERFFMGIFNGMRGRPKKAPEDRKTASMKIPLADGEKELIETAARATSEKPVTWAREVLLRAAKRKA